VSPVLEKIIISWQVLEKRISLYDYELILGEHGERLVAFGQYAGLAGMIDLLRGLGERKNYHILFDLFYISLLF
jgi:hypothetical protein